MVPLLIKKISIELGDGIHIDIGTKHFLVALLFDYLNAVRIIKSPARTNQTKYQLISML